MARDAQSSDWLLERTGFEPPSPVDFAAGHHGLNRSTDQDPLCDDILRDEGERYGGRLVEAGVRMKVVRFDVMNHGFFHMYGIVDKAKQALEESEGSRRFKSSPLQQRVKCEPALVT